jgi:adenylate cyclase
MLLQNWSNNLKTDLDKLSANLPEPAFVVSRLKEGERRVVTILFLDIEGFTAMSEKLDPEDVQLIIDRCFKILTGEIEKYGGYVDKYEGDRIMALFGTHRASEHDCENALRAAIAMKNKFEGINGILKERGLLIGVRIGVHTGLVVTGRIGKERDQDFTVMGDAVNLASRLEASSPANEILIEEETRRIAGDAFLYKTLGEISVKGRELPCNVYVVSGLNPKRTRRWERYDFLSKAPLFGREEEFQYLEDQYQALVKQESSLKNRVIGVTGPAGIGKSRLVDDFIKKLESSGSNGGFLLDGYAFTHTSTSYSLFSTALTDWIKRKNSKNPSEKAVNHIFSEIASYIPDAEENNRFNNAIPFLKYLLGLESKNSIQPNSMEPEALALEIKLAICSLVYSLANYLWTLSKIPLVLNLEDIQWADSNSLAVLDYILSNLKEDLPIFVILQYRSEFDPSPTIKRLKSFSELELGSLERKAILEIISSLLGSYKFRGDFEGKIVNKSMGNPLYVEELLKSLIEKGIIIKEDKYYTLAEGSETQDLPGSISRILLSRIDMLDEVSKKVLVTASVIGNEFDIELLSKISEKTGLSHEDLARSIDILARWGFLNRKTGTTYSFKSPVLKDAVYSTLLNYNRKILHSIAADSITEISGNFVEENIYVLANHYIDAEKIDDAFTYSILALKKAIKLCNNREALRLADRILALAGSSSAVTTGIDMAESVFEILEMRERVLDLLGLREDQKKSIDRLMEISDASADIFKKARVLVLRSKYYIELAEYQAALKDGLAAIDILEDRNKGALYCEALRILGMVHYNLGEFDNALSYFHRRIEISSLIQDQSHYTGSSLTVMAHSYNAIGMINYQMGRTSESIKYYNEALRILESTKDKIGTGMILNNMGTVHCAMGDMEQSLEYFEDALKIFRETSYKKGIANIKGNMGLVYTKLGQYRDALKFLYEATGIRDEINDWKGLAGDLLQMGMAQRAMNNHAESLALLQKAMIMSKEQGNRQITCDSLCEIALSLFESKDQESFERALASAQEAYKIAIDSRLSRTAVFALTRLAKIYLAMGKLDEAFDASKKALSLLEAHENAEQFTEEVYFNHYKVLLGLGKSEESARYLYKAYSVVSRLASRLKKIEFAQAFQANVGLVREIIDEKRKLDGAKKNS